MEYKIGLVGLGVMGRNLALNIERNGFPIAVCVALFYFMMKQEDKHKDENDKLSATVEANTKVLTELCTLIKTLVK